ncbi:PREDICTED: centromere-associated protein E [Dinoponera quadriceps]|uniref:Centromere-associated protein E n=1 Tax=Dinoponera quadriceps TaxID=609295 RepID=A0A6P3WXI4_DINQU|nr:PREDICTED: centromere-associated protein E [Dinoponera quadriceps]
MDSARSGGVIEEQGSDEDLSPDALVRQNYELRHRLEEEAASYKRRLDTYRQAQQHQAALVSRLQAKVLQYKQRCSELENQMAETIPCDTTSKPAAAAVSSTSVLDAAHQTLRDLREEQIHDLDTALKKLGEERRKCEKLLQLNSSLKDQLEESHQTNETLTNDLQKLSNDWDILREELAIKEDEWKEEEQAFNEYYTSEHNRLLNLWRDVVSVKRLFAEMKSATERDLSNLRNKITSSSNEITSACNSTSFTMRLQASAAQSMPSKKMQEEEEGQTMSDLRTEIAALRHQHDAAQHEIRTKEDRINQLIREIHNLEERCGVSEAAVTQTARMQEDIEVLQTALRDIAHAVIQDAESRDIDAKQAPPHIHLSPSGPIPQRSPKRGARSNTIPAFAESTISAVQAALHKYQLTIHELQVKLQMNKEQLLAMRKQCDTAEENARSLNVKVTELISQLDTCRSQCTQLNQEKEMLQKGLDTMRLEKNALDKNRVELNSMVEALNNDYDKLQKTNNKLQKMCDSLEDEKLYLQNELSRVSKDADLRELSLRSEEDRCSKMREELLTLREDLSKAYLAKDMLEQQKLETDGLISQIEKNKGDLELELERILLEKSDVQEILLKIEAMCSNHEQDKQRLQEELKRTTDEKNKLASQCVDQQGDLNSLRKELLQAEQTRLDIESEKVTLNEKIKFLEIEKEKVEIELGQVSRERGDLSNQLSVLARKKETLNEELMRIRQRLEQSNEMNARINRNLEDLVKDNEEKQVLLETNEKEFQRLQEQLASMRTEKETLEGVLFDTQTNLEATHVKKTQLEKEQKELLIKQESLKGQITRVTKELENSEKRAQDIKQSLTQQSGDQVAEFQQIISNMKKQSEDNIKKANDEKEQVRMSLEKRLQQSVLQLEGEKNDEINQLQQRIEELQQHIENLCKQHEEVLLRAENDKQQALHIAHHDQQALLEKLETIIRELEEEKSNLDRVKRDAAVRAEQERNNTNQLRDELSRLRTKLDETKLRADEEKMKLDLKIEELWKERESSQREAEELQVQLHMAEDKVDGLQNQLHDTIRKLKDTDNVNETLRKELVDVRRQLADITYEKEKYNNSNKELREHVKRIESERREQGRTLEELYQKISGLEDAKTTMDVERTRLQTQVRDMERDALQLQQQLRFTQDELQKCHENNAQAQNEEKELQSRLANETEERERIQLQLHQVKKQVVDLDNSLEVTRQELGRLRTRADEEDERWRAREQELLVRLEDSRCRERKLEDQKHNLEVCLADATQQLQELKARLGGSEGRVRALDAQLSQLESSKKEVEQKLSSVGSTLRRIAGIQLDGSVNMPFKLMSPSRRWSPARAQDHGEGRDVILDVDPEAVRKGVRSLMQQVAQIERERDDYKTELCSMKKQLTESQENQSDTDVKVNSLLANIRTLQEEKNSLEAKLTQKQSGYQAQHDALRHKTEECEQLYEKLTILELKISTEAEEKSQYEDKLEKMKQTLSRSEAEKRALQEEVGRSESRATKLELQRMSMDGDLQRLQMMLQEKDAHVQKLQDRTDAQSRTMASLEERCASLKSTIEQLNLALEKASATESELKAEMNLLQRNIMEITTASQNNNERLKQLQKQLSNTENDRRLLSERLETAQQTLSDLRHANQSLTDQNARLQNELANNEVQRSALESQLRLSSWPQEGSASKDEELLRQLQAAQRERSEMRGKVDALNDKVKLLEADKRNLERQVASAKTNVIRSKSYERPEKAHVELLGTSYSLDNLEHENRELRLKIRRLETQLAEKEAELIRVKSTHVHSHSLLDSSRDRSGELERIRAAQLQAEKLLEAREQSHRQQVLRLENQIQLLREQLNQEIKRRQLYVLRSSRAGREMQQLRQALGDSLRTVAQDPSLDAVLLEHEARKLDSTLTSTASLPPSLALPAPPSSYDRASTPSRQQKMKKNAMFSLVPRPKKISKQEHLNCGVTRRSFAMSDNIKVAIKIRPLIKREKDDNLPIQWVGQGNAIVAVDAEIKKRGDGRFQFDHIFNMDASNNDVFCSIVSPIIDAAVNGFNGTVFAYGQTSSGKTYTMMGTKEEDGIIPLAIKRLFEAIADTPGREFLLRVSYLEIYNEKVNDLLTNNKDDLKIHEGNGQVLVECKEVVINSPENILSLMSKGNKNRKIGETNMNERSSRSHTIFRITIESREAGSDGAIQLSQLNMVDLAGSERARLTGATGERFKEGRHINLSLSTLALVIKQLSESQELQKYINFRDSKLTRLLQTSLGGNAMTAIICAVTPAAIEETQCTLSFASRARDIKNKPQLNEVMSDSVLLKRYAKQINKLQTELERVKQQNWCVEVQEMEHKMQEKDRVNEELEERIRLLQTRIVAGDNRNNVQESFKSKALRRRTWCGTGAASHKLNTSVFHMAANLSPIKEMSPLRSRNSSSNLDTSFQIAYTDFELELLNNEVDREEEMSDDDTYITYRKNTRVKFDDDLIVRKLSSSCGNFTVSPETADGCTQTAFNGSPGTPRETLRERMHNLKMEYSELQEFTTLEKQLYFEDHRGKLEEKLAMLTTLEKRIENLTSDRDAFEHIASDLRKKLTAVELRCASAEDQVSAQETELQRIPELERKLAQLSALEVQAKSIPELQERITVLTAEKDGYEHVAATLHKKLNETEQCVVLLEDKLTTRTAEEEPLIRFSIGAESTEQAGFETLVSEKEELQREVSDLQSKLEEANLCNDSLREKLNEQRLMHEQSLQNLVEQTNELRSEKNEIESVMCVEDYSESEKWQDQEKRIQQLASEKHELELIIGELQEKLIEAEITTTSMKGEINEHQRCVQKFLQMEKQIQDIITEKMDYERINDELKIKSKEMELANGSLKGKLNEQQQKTYVLEKQIEDLMAEKKEFDAFVELQKRMTEMEQAYSLLQRKLNEGEPNILKFDDPPDTSSTETITFDNSKFEHAVPKSLEQLKEKEEPYDSLIEEKQDAEAPISIDSIEEPKEAESCNNSTEDNADNVLESTVHESRVETEHHSSAQDELNGEQLHLQRIRELEAQVARLTAERGEHERISAELREQSTKNSSGEETTGDHDDEVVRLKSHVNDLQNIIQDIQSENARLKELAPTRSAMLEHESDLYNSDFLCSSSKIDLSSTRMSLDEDSAKLSADLVTKTQELDEIKHDVQSLKEDIEKLQKTILLLTTENTELASKLSAEKACADQSAAHLQKTIDELYARNSSVTNEKIELENNMAMLNEQLEALRSKIPEVNLNEEQMMLKYEERINGLTTKNAELLSTIADNMRELEMLKESKSLLYEHDCKYKDKWMDLVQQHEYQTSENNELSTDLMDKIEENDSLRQECEILKSKLELSLKNKEDVGNNDTEQLRTENTLLKTELMELKANVRTLTEVNTKMSNQLEETMEDLDNARKMNSCNNTLHLSTILNSSSTANDTMNKTLGVGEDPEVRILNLREEVNQLTHLNRKLSDLKLSTCTQCSHLKELIDNRRMLKLEVKSLNHRLADLQKKFDRKSARSDALIMRAQENINSSLCNSSINTSFSENINVTYFEEQLECISNDIQSLKEDDNKLSDLCKEKCDEVEEFQINSVSDCAFADDESFSVKKPPSKTSSRINNIEKVMGSLQDELQDLKRNHLSVKTDLDKFTGEKESLLEEINSLRTVNEGLLRKLSENELSLTTASEKVDILENEVTDMTNRLQELTAKCIEIENAKLVLEVEAEMLREDKTMKEGTIDGLRQSLTCLQHELDLIKKQKEEMASSSNSLEQEYEKKLTSLMAMNEELTNSKATVSREYDNYSKESENRHLELMEKMSKCTSENEYLKQELIRLRDVEEKLEKMKNEYEFKTQQDNTLAEDNKKLKDVLNTTSVNIIKEIQSLKPKVDTYEFVDKSVDELFRVFLQTILAKEKEIAKTMQRHFEKERQKLEDEKRQHVDAEKRAMLWAKELEGEIEKLQGDLSKRETISDELQKEVARLQHVLEENNQEKDALRERNDLLETDLSNLQVEFDRYSKNGTVNEEAIIIAQKREKQAQETIKNKEAEFQMKLKSEKEAHNRRLEDLACTIESFKTKNMELTNNIEGLTANQKQLTNIIDLKSNELMKCNQIIQKMQSESEQLTDAYNELNQELEAKKSRVAEITELLKAKCDELTEYKTKLETLMHENNFLKQQISERKANVDQYKMEMEALKMTNEKAIDAIKDKLNLTELKSAELNKQITELNNKNISLTEESKKLSSDNETLRSKCIMLEKRVRNSTSKIQAEEQMEELKDLNRSLRNNLDGASNRITELQAAKADLMKQLVTLNSQYESTCRENGELKETLSSYKSKYNDAYANASSEKYDALLREKNQIALELEAVKVQLNQQSRDLENHASKVKELTEKNVELDQESEELAEVIRQNNEENARLQDRYYSCCVETDALKEKVEALEKRNQSLLLQAAQRINSTSAEKTEKPTHDDACSCAMLKDKIRELQSDVVWKNGKIATLELQIRSGSFPYQAKCKDLQEHLATYSNKNSELKAEVKRLQLAMLRTSAKECDACKERLVNRRNQTCQTIADNVVRFCSTSSGIIDEELRIVKLEKEKKIMKDLCRSRSKTIKELEKRIEEYETLLQSR